MGINEALEAKGFASKEKNTISKHWQSMSLNSETLKWFYNKNTATPNFYEQVLLVRVPEQATGHEGIAHGGFLAALLDEALCFGAFPVLPHKVGVTASLSVNYLLPTPAGAWIAVHSKAQTKEEGSRRANVVGSIYTFDFNDSILPWEVESKQQPTVEATQVVVEPKWHDKLTHK